MVSMKTVLDFHSFSGKIDESMPPDEHMNFYSGSATNFRPLLLFKSGPFSRAPFIGASTVIILIIIFVLKCHTYMLIKFYSAKCALFLLALN